MTQKQDETPVEFTPRQVAYLERMFPEVISSATTAEAEMRHRGGQRSVVAFIKSKVQK